MATEVVPGTENEDLGLLAPIDAMMHPYRGSHPARTTLPSRGRARAEVLAELEQLRASETERWRRGFASGAVYHGGDEHVDFIAKAYSIHSQTNQLHSDLWPSAAKFEAEIVAMTAHMLGAGTGAGAAPFGSERGIVGSVTSGGSESILLAVKAYRDDVRERRGVTEPELVLPVSAHAAFHKACQYFQITPRLVPVDSSFRAEIDAVRAAINDNTIAVVLSAVNFPWGTIDPIAEIGAMTEARGVGLHVDACLGGFLLPWVEKLGHSVPPFDFRVPGVTSMSCDTHKYGYAPKGTSVVLYRGRALRRRQYFTMADWPGGLYYSPTFAGSRPGGLSAACWATLMALGEDGYLDAARRILAAADKMKAAIRSMPELKLLGDAYAVFAFGSDDLDMYQLLDQLSARGWALTGLQRPAGIHVSTTLRTAEPGVAERFAVDLAAAVIEVKRNPVVQGGMAPIYGLAATIPDRSIVHEMLRQVMDVYYRL